MKFKGSIWRQFNHEPSSHQGLPLYNGTIGTSASIPSGKTSPCGRRNSSMPGMLGWVGLPGSLPLGLPSNLVNQLGNVTIIWIYMILYDIIWFILIYIYWFTYMLTKRPSIRCVQRNILQWMESWHHPPERRDQNTSDRPNQKIPDNRDFWMNLEYCSNIVTNEP